MAQRPEGRDAFVTERFIGSSMRYLRQRLDLLRPPSRPSLPHRRFFLEIRYTRIRGITGLLNPAIGFIFVPELIFFLSEGCATASNICRAVRTRERQMARPSSGKPFDSSPLDRDTVDRLVIEHLPGALRLALRLTGDEHTAEDIVQDALCRVLRQWRSYRGEAAFGTWLFRIVLNVDRDRRRRQRDVSPLPADAAASDVALPLEKMVADELHDKIRAATDALPQRQREVALLCLGEGLPADEAAQVLETTKGNVHTCLHLARKQIARAIGVDYINPDRK